MSIQTVADFIISKENKTITVKREFQAELPLVWDAYTKAEILDQWWAPKPWQTRTKSMDFRKGGRWFYAMVGPEGQEHLCVCDYKDIQIQKKFSGIDGFTDADGNMKTDMPISKWEVTFTGKGPVTLVEIFISFDDLAQLEAMVEMGFREGLSMAWENLDALLPSLKTS